MRKNTKITPEIVRAVKGLYESLPAKRGTTTIIAKVLGISIFTVNCIVKSNFNYDNYRAIITGFGERQKERNARKNGRTTSTSQTPSENTTYVNYLYRDKLVEQMGELVNAVRDLVDAWNARPTVEHKLEQPRVIRV
jgi:hypothetical protein